MIKNRILAFVLTLVVILAVGMPIAHAVTLTISLSSSTANSGDSITVTVNGNGITGKIELTASEGGTVSPSSVWVDNSKESATVKINGDKDVTVTATAVDASNSSDASPFSGATSAKIKVKSNETTNNDDNNNSGTQTSTETQTNTAETTKKSNNANLKNLGIKPNDFSGFKSGVTSYDVTVPNDVEKVTVYADKSDEKATVTGVGSKKIEVGKNALEVTVTAEDGTKKTYTINVTREAKNEENATTDETTENTTVNETTTTGQNSDLVKLEAVGFSLNPKFSPDVFEYKLQVNEDVDNIEIKTEGASSDVEVNVVGNTSLQEGENTITVLVKNKKDNKTSTYQILVTKTNSTDDANYAMQKGLKIRKLLVGAAVGFVLVCIIVFVIIKRKSKDDYMKDSYNYDEEDQERINLDDEEEFFNRVNRTKLKIKRKEYDEDEDDEDEDDEDKEDEESSEEFETPKALRQKTEQIEEDDDEDDNDVQYFRTSKSSKKGKHFE